MGQIVTLKTANHGGAQRAAEIGILAETLGDASPARIPGDVDHRRKRPVDAGCRRLDGGDARRLAHAFDVPGGGLAEGDRENRLEAVDDIPADDERYAQTALLQRDALQLVDLVEVHLIEHRPHTPFAHRVVQPVGAAVDLAELADLLGERHSREQFASAIPGVALFRIHAWIL